MNNRASFHENIFCSERGIENHSQIRESRFYSSRKSYSVLLLESNKSNQLKLETILEKARFNVTACSSMTKGLSLARKNYYDVIVTDIKMRGSENLEFISTLNKLKSGFPNPEIQLIVLASNLPDLEFEVIRRGADMFCDKKLAFKHLVKQIRFLLDFPLD